ncbi:MAG: glutamate synthase subunit beta, partial [Candidatus Omnitrophica bacterium]|nr:glutamate synthase subunit beta [Candidatus Omnitrophota bacterium]
PKKRTGKKTAVIGSGPAGLAAADNLNKYGHNVTVFEKDHQIGGLLRYGIPDFKLEKRVIDRRINILKKEGIKFIAGVEAGVDYPVSKLKKDFNAVCLAIGSRVPRDLRVKCRRLKGIYFAIEFLTQTNIRVFGQKIHSNTLIDAGDKNVVVIGGGDTGADCIGTANRQGARSVIQIEVMPRPPQSRTKDHPWPGYPLLLKTSTSHEEGAERYWSILTKEFIADKKGNVNKIACVRIEFVTNGKDPGGEIKEIPGSEFEIDADMVILAVGFLHPRHEGLLDKLKVKYDPRGNVAADKNYMTSVKGVFTAGDTRRGQSLIAWAIAEGRAAAKAIDQYLSIRMRPKII